MAQEPIMLFPSREAEEELTQTEAYEAPPPSFMERYEVEQRRKAWADTLSRVTHGVLDVAVPALAGATGAGAAALYAPATGPFGIAAGGAVGSAAGKGLQEAVNWGVERGYLPGRVEEPPTSVLEGGEKPPWWQKPMEYINEGLMGATGEIMPMIAGYRAAAKYGPRMVASREVPSAAEEASLRPGSVVDQLPEIGGVTKIGRGKWGLDPKAFPEEYRMIGRMYGPDAIPERGGDLLGAAAGIDASTLPAGQYKIYQAHKAAAKASARKEYALLDKVQKHVDNTATRGTLEVGEDITATGRVPRLNEYDIHIPFDYREVSWALDEMNDAIYKAMKAGRVTKPNKVDAILGRIMDNSKDFVVSWDTAYKDLAMLKKLAADPDFGTKEPWQGALIQVIRTMEPIVHRTLQDASRRAGYDPAVVFRSLREGNKAWSKFANAYKTKEARQVANVGAKAETSTVLGTAEKKAPRMIRLHQQFGAEGMDQWAGAHWQKTINNSMQAVNENTPWRSPRLDIVQFDKLLNAPGQATIKYLFPDMASYVRAVGEDAVQATRRELFDAVVSDGNYNTWFKISDRTKDFVAGGSPLLRAELDDFFGQMGTLMKRTDAEKAVADRLRTARNQLLHVGYHFGTVFIPPGTAGRMKRYVLRSFRDAFAEGDSTVLGYINRALVAPLPVVPGATKQLLPRLPEYILPPPEQDSSDIETPDPAKIQLMFSE